MVRHCFKVYDAALPEAMPEGSFREVFSCLTEGQGQGNLLLGSRAGAA